jgi:membrane protein
MDMAVPAVRATLERLGRAVVAAFDRMGADQITGISSQFAYNAFLATVPFLGVVVALVGAAGDAGSIGRVLDDLGAELPQDVSRQLKNALASATRTQERTTFLIVVGAVLGLYITSNAIAALIGGLDNVGRVPHRPWWRSRLVSLGLAVAAAVLVLVTTLALVGGPPLINRVAAGLGLGARGRELARQVIYPIAVVALLLFTVLLYRLGPNGERRPRPVLPGALFAVGGWIGATRLFRLYVENFSSYSAVYGSLGFVVVYMVFLYLTGLVLLLGAEGNAYLARLAAARAQR